MQAVFGSSQFLPVPSTSVAGQNSSGMGPPFWGLGTPPVDITQGGRYTDFSINAILRPGPFVRASRTPFRVRVYTEDTELPGPHHKECVQTGGEVSPISDASSNGEDPSSAWPVVTGQLNQDLQGDYPGTATGVKERDMRRNDSIPLPYLNNGHDMAADWPSSTSASDESAQAAPSTSTSAATNASSLPFSVSLKNQEEVLFCVSDDLGNNDYDMAADWPSSASASDNDNSAQAGPSASNSAATNASSLLCRVSSKDLKKILLRVSEDLRVSRGRAENRLNAQFSKRPRKVKTTTEKKLRRSVRNKNGNASPTVSAGSSGDLKSRNPGPWRLRSSNPPRKILFSDDDKETERR